MEALSITNLVNLAINPGLSNDNPSPLVLYIIKVPGSRDVFLTTTKPRNHTISAHDVQSCLYFIHKDRPEDNLIFQSPDDASEMSQQMPSPLRVRTKAFDRKPIYTQTTSMPTSASTSDQNTPPESTRRTMIRRKSITLSDIIPQKLTVIRRNPLTGQQWNVARVYDQFIKSALTAKHHTNLQPPITLIVENPRYAKFLSNKSPLSSRHDFTSELIFQEHQESYSHNSFLLSPITRSMASYNFTDIWGKTCKYTTASNGRGLVCSQIAESEGSASEECNLISDLRFNLPILHYKPKSRDLNAGYRQTPSLAGEAAGGGAIGRQVKLGKLIIHSKGQAMLDLVITANMALWWRTYEPTRL